MADPQFDPAEYEALQRAAREGVTLRAGTREGPGIGAGTGGFDSAEFESFKQQGGEIAAPTLRREAEVGPVGAEVERVGRTGVSNAVANVLGMPVDLVNSVVDAYNAYSTAATGAVGTTPAFTVPRIPIGGREQIKEAAGQTAEALRQKGVDIPPLEQPRTSTGRVAARAIEEIGTNVATGLAGRGAAVLSRGPVRTAAEIGKETVGPVARFSEKLRDVPVKDLVKLETIVSSGGGVGAGVGREVSQNPLVELAGLLVGSFGTAGALGIVRWFRNTVVPAKTMAGAEREVSRYLTEAIPEGSMVERNLQESGAITSRFPEVQLTTGQATASRDILRQTARAAEGNVEIGARLAEQPGRATGALKGAVEEAAGRPEGEVAQTQATLRGQQQQRVAEAEAETGRLRAAEEQRRQVEASGIEATQETLRGVGAAVDEVARQARADVDAAVAALPRMDRRQAGQVLNDIIQTRGTEVKQAAGALFDRVDDTIPLDPGRRVSENVASLRETVETVISEATQGVGRGREIPAEIRDISRNLGEGGTSRSFGEVRRWRSDILAALRREVEPGSQQARMLNRVADAIDGTLDQAAASSVPYEQAAAAYRDYIERFRQGVVAEVQRRGRRGEALAGPAEDVARQFWRSGKRAGAVTTARQFIAAVGDVPQAREALTGAALDDFVQLVSRDGKVSSKLAQRWLNDHREVLNVFPEVRELVQGVVARTVRAESAEGLRKSVGKFLTDAKETAVAARVERALRGQEVKPVEAIEDAAFKAFTDADPREAMSTILGAKDRGQTARRIVADVQGDPAAMAGLKRALADELQKAARGPMDLPSRGPLFNPEGYGKFLDQHDEVAQAIFGPKAVNDFKELQRMGTILMTPLKADADSSIMQGISKRSLFTIDAMLSRAYNVQRQMVGIGYSLSDIGIRIVANRLEKIGAENLRVVMDRALFDPEAAKVLLRAGRELVSNEAIVQDINKYAASVGTVARGVGASERLERERERERQAAGRRR